MTVAINQLRMVAAIAHAAVDLDVEVSGTGRRWLVSANRPDATIDPCGFRQLVLATTRGCRLGLLPVDRVAFTGAWRETGGGIFRRRGEHGMERCFPVELAPPRIEALLAHGHPDADDSMSAHLHGDDELGVTVVTLSSTHPAFERRLDNVTEWLLGTCLVDELIAGIDHTTTT